jgi:hypothetical protein
MNFAYSSKLNFTLVYKSLLDGTLRYYTIKLYEKTIECPDSKTIYHHKHLSIWLRIRKTCPICKNLIENQPGQSYTFMKNNSHFNSFRLSHNGLYSNRKKKVSFHQIYQAENLYLLECHHCGNVLNSHLGNSIILCNVCGSSITQNFQINLRNKGHIRSINLKKKDKRSNHEKIISLIRKK